jgi:hypothetical protein
MKGVVQANKLLSAAISWQQNPGEKIDQYVAIALA